MPHPIRVHVLMFRGSFLKGSIRVLEALVGFKRPYKYTYSVYTSASKYQEGDDFKAKVCTIWVHGPVNPKTL